MASRRLPTRISRPRRLGSWSGDAKRAMTQNPDYFVWWYTAKSVGLAAALAGLAYLYGKSVTCPPR